jgi:hypothetical protein
MKNQKTILLALTDRIALSSPLGARFFTFDGISSSFSVINFLCVDVFKCYSNMPILSEKEKIAK